MLTWMDPFRPQKLTVGVNEIVESDVRVRNSQILHLSLESQEQQPVYRFIV